MSGVLIYSEQTSLALELLSGGREIAATTGVPLCAALLGSGMADFSEACIENGAETVYVAKHPQLDEQDTQIITEALAQITKQKAVNLVLIGSTRRGRTVAPGLAQKLDAGCVTDALKVQVIDGRLVSQRYSLGGNTIKEVAISSPIGVIAVTPGTFEVATSESASSNGTVEEISLDIRPARTRVASREKKAAGAVNIEEAQQIVCVGRGIENQDDLTMIQSLLDTLGAELAGTRPLAYEYGWITEDRMIGISGKKVRPQLYIAIGLSGQIQHAVSIRDAKVILAINKDKNAPIFEMADYGLVGDLYEIVPLLTEALKQR